MDVNFAYIWCESWSSVMTSESWSSVMTSTQFLNLKTVNSRAEIDVPHPLTTCQNDNTMEKWFAIFEYQ